MKLKKSKNENNARLAAAGTAASICSQVKKIYDWIDSNIESMNIECSSCGKCCDFESFGHKLFVTTPELLYFYANLKPLRKMTAQTCPYMKDNKCTARDFRFAGCRIFFCKSAKGCLTATDTESQNQLSETTVGKFKSLCDKFNLPYRYVDLRTALNSPELAKLVDL